MKKLACLLTVSLIALASAVFITLPSQALDDIPLPSSFYDGDAHPAKVVGDLKVTNLSVRIQSQSVTNGQLLVSLTGTINVISPGPVGTNTITLAAPGTSGTGRVCTIVVDPSVTNLLAIADSGNVALSGAFSGGASDTLTLFAINTGTWAQVSTSNN